MKDELTQREQETHDLAVSGYSYKEIAVALGISPDGVKKHLRNVYRKKNVSGKTELAKIYQGAPKVVIDAAEEKYPYVGLWVSRFTYTRFNGSKGVHIGIEKVWRSNSSYSGENVSITTQPRIYRHNLQFDVYERFLLGKWINSNSSNVGVFQLRISSSRNVMVGMHLGNDNNLVVREGAWEWVRVLQTGKNRNLCEPDLIQCVYSRIEAFDDGAFDYLIRNDLPLELRGLTKRSKRRKS